MLLAVPGTRLRFVAFEWDVPAYQRPLQQRRIEALLVALLVVIGSAVAMIGVVTYWSISQMKC
jgi:hypothetical protein